MRLASLGLAWPAWVLLRLAGANTSYPGGSDERGYCIDICEDVPHDPACYDPEDEACRSKTNSPGDWDYLALDQLYLPQYCRDLEAGIDDAVTHQHVDTYPQGVQCIPGRVQNALTIHGLWPDYTNGYPSCCRGDFILNQPLDPHSFAPSYPGLLSRMDQAWRDPTTPDASASLCQLWNHEWQKHGYCLGYGLDGQDANESAERYFLFTLEVAQRLDDATRAVAGWAEAGKQPRVEELRGLYGRRVQVMCSKGDREGSMGNRLVSVRTCWERGQGGEEQGRWGADEHEEGGWHEVEMRDCEGERSSGNLVPCDEARPVSLALYRDPSPAALEEAVQVMTG